MGPANLAKTTRPSLAGVLSRERLFGMLDRRRHASLIWVAGPAGYGKTTLVSSYIESREPCARWYQLDPADADVATFFYYLSSFAPRQRGDASLPLYTPEYHDDLAAFSRMWFRRLFAALEQPFVIVLDNYQDVTRRSALHEVVLHAVAEMPPDGCIIAISRAGPPPATVRLRANRALEVIDWNDLRLTREESDAIVDGWETGFSAHARGVLYERTEGWAAGLVLMMDQATNEGLLASGPDLSRRQLVFDYLAGEFVDRFDDATRNVLIATAGLPEMTGEMAADLSGEPGAGEMLERLHRNYHLVGARPGASGVTYHYHPLLRDFLRARAKEVLPASHRRQLSRQAATLLESAGSDEDALALLRDERDWNELTRLVLARAPSMLRQGRAESLEQWLDELPKERFEAEPWLVYWRGACRFYSAPRECRLMYEQAYDAFRAQSSPDPRGLVLACSGAMDAIIYELDDLARLDRLIVEAQSLLSRVDLQANDPARCRAVVSLFLSLVFRQPQHPEMADWASQAREALPQIDDENARINAQLLLAITLNYTGQFSRARELIDVMRRLCHSPYVTPLALKVLKDVESMYYMLVPDHEQCLRAVHEGVEIGRTSGVRLWTYHILSNGVAGALAVGDLDTAEDLLAEMGEHPESARRLDRCLYHYYGAWLAHLREDVVLAYTEHKTALHLAVEAGCPFYEVLCHLALAQVLFELGEERRVAASLRRVRALSRHIDNRFLAFQGLLVFAHIALATGRRRIGLSSLAAALALGRENAYRHFLGWRPRVIAGLCVTALEEGIEVDYVRTLIRERNLRPATAALHVPRWPWPLELSALGRFEVRRDDGPIGRFARIKQKPVELLKAVVALGPEAVTEASVAGALWPRIEPEYAQRSLSTNLHRLRKLLGFDQAVTLRHGRLSLDPNWWWLDVRVLDALADEVGERLARDALELDRDEAMRLSERLVTIYRGPFMASEGDQPLYRAERERLRGRFLRTLGDLGRFLEARGQYDEAAQGYHRALAAEPAAEGLYRRLMTCYRDAGRAPDALEVFDRCRSTLAATGEEGPSRETVAVYERIVESL